MALFGLKTKHPKAPRVSQNLELFLKNFSIEVMPRTAEKVENFKDILPKNTRVYIAHIEGTPIEDMWIPQGVWQKMAFPPCHTFLPEL